MRFKILPTFNLMFVDVKLDKEADNKLVIANLDFGIYHKSV